MNFFSALNNAYLEEINKLYKTEFVSVFFSNFKLYNIINKKNDIYLLLPLDQLEEEVNTTMLLKELNKFENSSKKSKCFVCVIPKVDLNISPTLFFNGKSFIHFILFDNNMREIVFNNDFFYSNSKEIKNLQNLYNKLFLTIIDNQGTAD